MRRALFVVLSAACCLMAALPVAAQGPCGDAVTVVAGDTLSAIARRCETTPAAILRENPDLSDPNLIRTGMTLRMPQPGIEPPPDQEETYLVRPGDTLSAIATRFGSSVEAIVNANPEIRDPNLVRVGQRLTIPSPGVQPRISIRPTAGPPGTAVTFRAEGYPANTRVTVGLGREESEFAISEQHTTDAEGAVSAEIAVPGSAGPGEPWVVVVQTTDLPRVRATSNTFTVTAPEGAPVTYTVRPGDTLTAIAQRFATTVSALLGANPAITNPNLIVAGQQLTVPPPPDAPAVTTVHVPLVRLEAGELGCGDLLVFVERTVPATTTPLMAALRELLTLPDDAVQDGLYNALSASELEIDEAAVNDGRATIRLSGQLATGGVCDLPRVEAQLRGVALHFDAVEEVDVFVNGRPLEEVLSLRG